jgi:hypothetical protein
VTATTQARMSDPVSSSYSKPTTTTSSSVNGGRSPLNLDDELDVPDFLKS